MKTPVHKLLGEARQERTRHHCLAHCFCGMDLLKVLSQMILLLLFLYLSPLGGHSHPLGSPSQSPEQFKMQVSTEGLQREMGSAERDRVCLKGLGRGSEKTSCPLGISYVRVRKPKD